MGHVAGQRLNFFKKVIHKWRKAPSYMVILWTINFDPPLKYYMVILHEAYK